MLKNLIIISLIAISSAALAMPAPKSGPDQVPGASTRADVPQAPAAPVYTPPGHMKISPPDGWIADNQAGSTQGVAMVFYPKGGSWATSPAVLYLRTAERINGSVQKIIDADVASYQDINPNITVDSDKNLFTGDGAIAIVKKLKDSDSGNMELIAYILQEQTISIITLNARTEKKTRRKLIRRLNLWLPHINSSMKTAMHSAMKWMKKITTIMIREQQINNARR